MMSSKKRSVLFVSPQKGGCFAFRRKVATGGERGIFFFLRVTNGPPLQKLSIKNQTNAPKEKKKKKKVKQPKQNKKTMELSKKAKATLGTGDMKAAVILP